MDIRLGRTDGEGRGTSELLGVVLLFGLVAIGAVMVLVYGTLALDTLEQRATLDVVELTMQEVDGSIGSAVEEPVQVELGQTGGSYGVATNGSMHVVVNDEPVCSTTLTLGSLRYQSESGDELAYEGGGIWKQTPSGAVMVSSPRIRYRDGQLFVAVTNVSGEVGGGATTLLARQYRTPAGTTSQAVRDLYAHDGCYPADNVTLTVQSDFYRAWGRYFSSSLNESSTVVNDSVETASVTLPIDSQAFAVNASNSSVTANTAFNATIEVLGTELSGIGGGNVYYGATTFKVVAGGDEFTPWPDGDPGDTLDGQPAVDDVNDPTVGEHHTFDISNYPAGTNLTVEATSWNCDDWEDSGQDTMVSGSSYDQIRCSDTGGERIAISSDSQSSNLVLLRDGEQVPDFTEGGPEQRDLSDILGSRIDGSGELDLQPNEVVFLYELSQSNADPANAPGSGDPDYNDAVVLVTIEQTWDSTGDFSIRIEDNTVVVEEEDE
ncbi:DUF7289 family protein [Haloarchaeobius sp. DT45]|uniref:DUF7289 family protein n=1 Tax=Haloarchaeobius sp. DT45 TaxID=3446116 RepID=UPI003F6B9793